jgi:hypothetical protein
MHSPQVSLKRYNDTLVAYKRTADMTAQQLQEASVAVNYEVKQLWYGFDAYQRFRGDPKEPNIGTLAFEAFLLHYRCLREFLAGNGWKDDIKAGDFISGWTSPDWPDHFNDPRRNTDPRYSEHKQIDKRLSHLTYFREEVRKTTPLVRDWQVTAMYGTARDQFLAFVRQLEPERIEWFSEAVTVLRSE